MTFEPFAKQWLATLTIDASSIEMMESRFRVHVFPRIGAVPMVAFQPARIRQLMRTLQDAGLAVSYQRVIFANVSAVFTAAVDDGIILRNLCRAGSVKPPKLEVRKVKPWSASRVQALRRELPKSYRAMVDVGAGCGLRQGEIFGLAMDEVDFLNGIVHVVRQVKIVGSQLVFAPPKGGKLRDVPLPDGVAGELEAHILDRPPVEVTLPWKTPDGPKATATLLFYSREHKAVNRNYFNNYLWKPALVATGLIGQPERARQFDPSRELGMHALRHYYASVLLDAGENIKALSEYLGHSDPGFTLRTYTHLMPTSHNRTREAVDRALYREHATDGPQTAQTSD